MAKRRSKRSKVKNVARQQPLSRSQVADQANTQIFLREFNPDFDQIILRLSVEATQGLRFGSPPGSVGE